MKNDLCLEKLNREELINFYFQLKISTMTKQNIDQLISLIDQHNFHDFIIDEASPLLKIKKDFFKFFLEKYFQLSESVDQQFQRLEKMKNNLVSHFQIYESKIKILLIGSFGNGVINNNASDLDVIFILPQLLEDQIYHELQCLESLNQIGFHYSKNLCYFQDIEKIFQSGKGLSRLYGLNEEGITFDCRLIGQKDAEKVTKLHPNRINRLKSVSSYPDRRCGLSSESKYFLSPTNYVTNFTFDNGKIYKGFFVEEFLISQEIYGNSGTIIDDVWLAVVKAFLYHNGFLKKVSDKYLIFIQVDLFDLFFKTLYYSKPENYSRKRYKELKEKFWQTVKKISNRYGIEFFIC